MKLVGILVLFKTAFIHCNTFYAMIIGCSFYNTGCIAIIFNSDFILVVNYLYPIAKNIFKYTHIISYLLIKKQKVEEAKFLQPFYHSIK